MALRATYQQRVKSEVRHRILTTAVTLLTRNRARAAVINPNHVDETLQYTLRLLQNPDIAAESTKELTNWTAFHQRIVGKRRPSDLKVLFLCGPEPLNDLAVLLDKGINPHNVWAVESDPEEFQRATAQLLQTKLPVKIYPGDLAGFLELNNESFDIIYVDGCSPFGSGRPNSLFSLLQLFKHQRLAPLGILITTFAALEESSLSWYADVIAAFFRYRYNDAPRTLFESGLDPAVCEFDDGALRNHIRLDPEPYYSDFITRFISDLARSIIPNCRAFAYSGIERTHLKGARDRNAAIATSIHIPPFKPGMSMQDLLFATGDIVRNPGGYPILSFLRTLEERSSESPIWNQLKQVRLGSRGLLDGAHYAALLENCIEGHWKAMGEVLLEAIKLGWFDYSMRLSCDLPLPNLMVNSFLGIHGSPAFPNPAVSNRFRYVSKKTTMYTDLIVFDRCRSYYDWFPTAHVAKARFQSKGFQLVARCIMDRIGWADWHATSHPFHGAAMAGMGATKHANAVTFGPRIEIE